VLQRTCGHSSARVLVSRLEIKERSTSAKNATRAASVVRGPQVLRGREIFGIPRACHTQMPAGAHRRSLTTMHATRLLFVLVCVDRLDGVKAMGLPSIRPFFRWMSGHGRLRAEMLQPLAVRAAGGAVVDHTASMAYTARLTPWPRPHPLLLLHDSAQLLLRAINKKCMCSLLLQPCAMSDALCTHRGPMKSVCTLHGHSQHVTVFLARKRLASAYRTLACAPVCLHQW
jgi:hypothetical protein